MGQQEKYEVLFRMKKGSAKGGKSEGKRKDGRSQKPGEGGK